MLPELYEHLLTAASTLPLQPTIPVLTGERLSLNTLKSNDISKLLEASDGTALYGESAYDPARIWGWINTKKNAKNPNNSRNDSNSNNINSIVNNGIDKSGDENGKKSGKNSGNIGNNIGNDSEKNVNGRKYGEKSTGGWPCDSEKDFLECYQKNVPSDSEHLVIVDTVTLKQIGMLSLVDNRPTDLCIRIGNGYPPSSLQPLVILSTPIFCHSVPSPYPPTQTPLHQDRSLPPSSCI